MSPTFYCGFFIVKGSENSDQRVMKYLLKETWYYLVAIVIILIIVPDEKDNNYSIAYSDPGNIESNTKAAWIQTVEEGVTIWSGLDDHSAIKLSKPMKKSIKERYLASIKKLKLK